MPTIRTIAEWTSAEVLNINNLDQEVRQFDLRVVSCAEGSVFAPYNWTRMTQADENMLWAAVKKKKVAFGFASHDGKVSRNLPQLRVNNVNEAILTVANKMRNEFKGTLIGVTGTAGKTTVKTMAHHVLKAKEKTWFSRSNQNLVPYTVTHLCGISNEFRYAVMEIGMYDKHSVEESAELARPHISVITSIGIQHATGLENPLEEIIEEKTSLFRSSEENGVAILPSSSPHFAKLLEKAQSAPNIKKNHNLR